MSCWPKPGLLDVSVGGDISITGRDHSEFTLEEGRCPKLHR